ncbi:MAG TPA: hypothetical protein PLU87_18985 [Sedimentisphaerales bacterium]|nr:hypothetical protein [Sedimentisphaerales bacterium]HRS13212.1 hypothetical protein [Sedimentisphaerales bacterium]
MTRYYRKDRFRGRRYFAATPPGFDQSNTAYLCLQWDCDPNHRFFWSLTKAIYRVAAATGVPPSRITAQDLVDWYSSRWWRRLGYSKADRFNRAQFERAAQPIETRLIHNALDAVYTALDRKAG